MQVYEGINFWETADQYGSHPHVGEALKKVEREEVVILTKTNSKTYKDVKKDLDRFRIELGTDYLDIILLHAVTDPEWNQNMKGANPDEKQWQSDHWNESLWLWSVAPYEG